MTKLNKFEQVAEKTIDFCIRIVELSADKEMAVKALQGYKRDLLGED